MSCNVSKSIWLNLEHWIKRILNIKQLLNVSLIQYVGVPT